MPKRVAIFSAAALDGKSATGDSMAAPSPFCPSRHNSCNAASCSSACDTASGIMISRALNRASKAGRASASLRATKNAPVDISAQATAQSAFGALPRQAKAAIKLCALASRRLSSFSVPAVTSRTTSRRTTDFEPRFLASAGSSVCSHMATRKPALIRRCK